LLIRGEKLMLFVFEDQFNKVQSEKELIGEWNEFGVS
jgi:hypothetical protein